jgi:hypothetical protein
VEAAKVGILLAAEHGACRRYLVMRNRRTQPSRQRTYIRLRARVDRLEDAISHFYNVITELRSRVSTLEKELKPLAKSCLVVREEFRSH